MMALLHRTEYVEATLGVDRFGSKDAGLSE